MLRYLRLFTSYVRTSLVRELEFRSGFFSLGLGITLTMAITLIFFTALYRSVPSIRGWTYPEALLLVGTYLLLKNVSNGLFYRNFTRTSEYLNQGRLDLLLTKPVDPQFAFSLRYTGIADLLSGLVSIIVIGRAMQLLQVSLTLGLVLGYLSLFILGVAVIYGLWFGISLLSFWLTQIDEIQELWYGLFDFTQYPRGIFTGAVRTLLTLLIPILTIVSFPAEFFLGRIGPAAILINLGLATLLFSVTRVLWFVGLRRYSSASS